MTGDPKLDAIFTFLVAPFVASLIGLVVAAVDPLSQHDRGDDEADAGGDEWGDEDGEDRVELGVAGHRELTPGTVVSVMANARSRPASSMA